jgi:hypothetical protein
MTGVNRNIWIFPLPFAQETIISSNARRYNQDHILVLKTYFSVKWAYETNSSNVGCHTILWMAQGSNVAMDGIYIYEISKLLQD